MERTLADGPLAEQREQELYMFFYSFGWFYTLIMWYLNKMFRVSICFISLGSGVHMWSQPGPNLITQVKLLDLQWEVELPRQAHTKSIKWQLAFRPTGMIMNILTVSH